MKARHAKAEWRPVMNKRLLSSRSTSSTRHGVVLVGFLSALAFLPSSVQAQRSLGPNADFSKICAQAPKPHLTRDWKKWETSQAVGNLEEMFDAASVYADGSAQVVRDPATARKLFENLANRNWPGKGRATYRLGRLMLDPAAGPVDAERAASLFTAAASMLHMDASVQLARLHVEGRIAGADVKEAERLLRTASAAGNVDGVIGLARLQRSGRVGDVPKAVTDDLVKLGFLILHGDLGKGKCNSLYEIGTVLADEALVPGGVPEAVKWFEASSRHGDYRADVALAEIYTEGRASASSDTILKHLNRAAAAGAPEAMTALGERMLRGDGMAKDLPKAVAWLEKAGSYADIDAYKILARHYRGEFGASPDLPKAAEALTRASGLPGHSPGVVVALARLHVMGINGQPDIKSALAFYRKAADLGDPSALTEFAKLLLARPQDASGTDILGLLKEAAGRGNPESMSVLSDLYACSAIVSPDAEQARGWLESAAEAGHARSIAVLAAQTNGDPAAVKRSIAALTKSAENGDREGMILLSLAYRTGQGVAIDGSAAEHWKDAALAPGEDRSRALLLLARRLLSAEEASRDEATAKSLLQEAVQAGDPNAMLELGRFLVSQEGDDQRQGMTLLQKAASTGNSAAMLALADQSDEQLRSTAKTAAEWRRAAVDAGSARAAIALAAVSTDQAEVTHWIQRAEALPVCMARDMAELAQVYRRMPDTQSNERARMWIGRALNDIKREQPDPAALFLIGRVMLDGELGEQREAVEIIEKSASAGKVEAMRFLGRSYASGKFGEGKADEAVDWFGKALRQGDEISAIELARLAGSSADVERSAVAVLKENAEADSVPAMREYGRSLQFGFGIPAEPEQGANWLRKAAEEGDTAAMKELSRAYASGYGVELSANASTEWLLRAAHAGDAEAMYGVSLAMTLGFGTDVNAEAAQKWLTTAETAARR
jgi:TPR repeat protein